MPLPDPTESKVQGEPTPAGRDAAPETPGPSTVEASRESWGTFAAARPALPDPTPAEEPDPITRFGSSADGAGDATAGAVLDYELLIPLGEGGMGRVWKA